MNRWLHPLAGAAAAVLLAGCASFSQDGGFGKVADLSAERTGRAAAWQRSPADRDAAAARVAELLAQPLSADSAVEIALLDSPALQASFAELGIAEASLVRAGRLANPTIGFGRLSGGGIVEIDRSIVFDLLGLLMLPLAQRIEQGRFEQAQLQAALDAVSLAADTRRAFFGAVAAQQLVAYAERVKEAADASGELAQRMLQAGNFNKLAQMREQAFQADATAQLARARQRAVAERERLVRRLGRGADAAAIRLPERLPDLPEAPAAQRDAEQTAMEKRLDVQLARHATATLATSLGLTRATRMVDVLQAGYANKSQSGEAPQNGYRIELELPLFDFGSVRLAGAEARYTQSLNHTAAVALNARSEVRESHAAYRTAHELARHYRDEVVPLRKRISDENLLRYNGMLIGVFELLADAREQITSVTGAVEALRDYWLAETDLQMAIGSRSPEPPATAAARAAP